MARERLQETIDAAELSSRIRGLQFGGAKIIIIELDLASKPVGNSDPTTLADAIYRREGKEYVVVRDRFPREPIVARKRARLE